MIEIEYDNLNLILLSMNERNNGKCLIFKKI